MKTLIILLLSIMAQISMGQSLTVIYEESANIENQLKGITDPEIRKRVSDHLSSTKSFILSYQDGISSYAPIASAQQNSNLPLQEGAASQKLEIGNNNGSLYKNHHTKEYLYETDLLGKKFIISDTLQNFNWRLDEEEKIIGNFTAKKATAAIQGEHITAYYAPALAIADGPKDYYGLPGLIVALFTDKRNYQAIEVRQNNKTVDIRKPTAGEVISKARYEALLEQKIKEIKQGVGSSIGGIR